MARKRKASNTRKSSTRGTTKSSTRKYTTRKKANQKTMTQDMMGGVLVVLGLILFVFLKFENIGILAETLKNVLTGLFGKISYLLPLSFIISGIIAIYSDEKVKTSHDILKGIYLTFIIATAVSSFANTDYNMMSNLVRFASNNYNMSVAGENVAGLLGTCASALVINFVGAIAARILLVFLAFVSTLIVFKISFKQFFNALYNVYAYIYNAIATVVNILFADEDDDDEEEEMENSVKSKRVGYSNAHMQNEQMELDLDQKANRGFKFGRKRRSTIIQDVGELDPNINELMREKGNPENVEENLRQDISEQVEFDFNKLGGKPTEEELQAKKQRDDFFQKQKEQKEDKSVKEVLTIDHTKHVEIDNYEFPPINLLGRNKDAEEIDKKSIHATAVKLQKTLASFGVEAKVINITTGPTVTRYELAPSVGVKVSKIVNLADDIALNLAAKSIRIEAPIPGKAAVGIEVPNQKASSVFLREVIESKTFKDHESKLAFSLGKDAAGEIAVGDIAKMPHVLIAGSTGSGKSVCINSLIVSILYKAKPSEVKMILIDPKMVELSGYNGIPHLLIPVVTDPKKAAGALNWAVQEMVNRYKLFAEKGVKDIKGYNKVIKEEEDVKLPQIVIIVDELADLMMVAPNDVEDAICRLAQMARAAGMHLVIATQRPSVDVITGIIKANIPSRIAFTVSSQVDSRTILDMAGAEKLLGKGDMLYFPVGENKPLRIQGAFISEKEIDKIVKHIKDNTDLDNTYSDAIMQSIENANSSSKPGEASNNSDEDDSDPLLNDAIDLVVDVGQASASMIQRKFKVGHSRAGRIIDQMEERGLISGYGGSKPRQVLVSKAEWQELKMGTSPSTSQNTSDVNNATKRDETNNTQVLTDNNSLQNVSNEEVIIPDKDQLETVENVASSIDTGNAKL